MNRDVVKTSLSLIKERIIKTDTVLNIVCDRNATIADLQFKLDLISAKFIEKCQDFSVLEEKHDSKDKQIYSLTTRLVKLQEKYDQLAFDSTFAQTQSNEKYIEKFLIIQNLETELIKLNDLVNKLKAENVLFKEQNGANVNFEGNDDGIFKAAVKDLKGRIKILENDVKEKKRLLDLCQRDLQTSREECERLDSIFNNFKPKAVEKCLTCSQNSSTTIEATLFKSNLDVQKEKYNKLYSQFEELQLSVNKLKIDNIKVAEKYSNLLLNQENQPSVKKLDVSSQTIENKNFNVKNEIEENRIDVNEKIVRIRQLKSEKLRLKEDLCKAIEEKRILQTDFNYLSEDNNKIHDKYEAILLEKEVLLMENKVKANLVSIETQTCHFLQEKSMYFEEIVYEDRFSRNNHSYDTDDLGLNLSSDSDSEKEFSFCQDILERMIRLPKIISPLPSEPKTFIRKGIANLNNQLPEVIIPEIKITPASPIGNIDFLTDEPAQAIISDNLSLLNENDANFDENLIKIPTNNESTQTDFDSCKDIVNLRKVDFGCQKFFDILTEERGTQCSKKYKKCKNGSIFLQKALVKIKINRRRYKFNFKRKNAARRNLQSALEVFRKYAISMSFENGNLLNLESKNNKLQINAINCFLFYKSNRLLKRFCRKFRDLKEALNIANRNKLTAVILNGLICDKKLIEDNEIIDKEIKEIINNCHSKKSQELNAILDGEDNLKGFGNENANLKLKKVKNLVKKVINKKKLHGKVFNNLRKIRIQRLNDLRTKFEMEAKILDINEQNVTLLEVKNTKLYYSSLPAGSKDNNSVDFDSGYTDGSVSSESSIKEIEENNSIIKRVLRSSLKTKNSDDSLHANLMNKKRIVLFGSYDSDDSNDKISEKFVVQKAPVKRLKVSKLEKMRQTIRNYNLPAGSKDNNSVDFDSGYTDGSVSSESSIKEIEENNSIIKRVLRSSLKRKNSDDSLNANLMNKKRKVLEKVLFGSDDSDDSNDKISEKLVVQKARVKKPKVSKLEKMRQTIRNYNPTARSNTCVKIDENEDFKKQLCLVAKERKKATKSVKSKQSFIDEMSNQNEEKQCKVDLESTKDINNVKNINKEHLIQRYISDIPVKKVEKTVFKKLLARRKINVQDVCENDLLVSTKNIVKNVDNNDVTSEESVEEKEDDEVIKLLNRLIQYNCEETVISDVCEQLKHASTKQISRLIIHRLYKFRSEAAQPSHTPLAPDLSPIYKTLIGFANILSEKRQDIFTELLDQLEIRFLLHNNRRIIKKTNLAEDGSDIQGVIPTYSVMSLEQIYRVYVSLCMLRTEVLRLRRFLCDMAFYQRDGWYALMYAVFTIWPAVLPKHFDENNKPMLKENDALLMKVLMFFVFKKRNSDEYMYYRPFLTTFAFGYYKYTSDSLHMKTIFDELVQTFTTSDSNIIAYSLVILLQRITNTDLMDLLRSESFNNVFKASDEEALIGKSKLLWLLDKIIPEVKIRGDRAIIRNLHSILEILQTRVENEKVKNFIQNCIGKLI